MNKYTKGRELDSCLMIERVGMCVSFVYIVALCLVVLHSSSSLTAGASPPSCRDREVGEWWAGLKENALQPDPAPFWIETELAETSASTNCAKQFNGESHPIYIAQRRAYCRVIDCNWDFITNSSIVRDGQRGAGAHHGTYDNIVCYKPWKNTG